MFINKRFQNISLTAIFILHFLTCSKKHIFGVKFFLTVSEKISFSNHCKSTTISALHAQITKVFGRLNGKCGHSQATILMIFYLLHNTRLEVLKGNSQRNLNSTVADRMIINFLERRPLTNRAKKLLLVHLLEAATSCM